MNLPLAQHLSLAAEFDFDAFAYQAEPSQQKRLESNEPPGSGAPAAYQPSARSSAKPTVGVSGTSDSSDTADTVDVLPAKQRQAQRNNEVALDSLLQETECGQGEGLDGINPPPRWRAQLRAALSAERIGTVQGFHDFLVDLRQQAQIRPEASFLALCSVVLSSQTRDATCLSATRRFASQFGSGDPPLPSPQDIATARLVDIEDCLRGVNFYKNKAKQLQQLSQSLIMSHRKCEGHCVDDALCGVDIVPRDFEALVSLPGVGPKVAHLVRAVIFDDVEDCGMVVDTHVLRVAHRFGWTSMEEARDAERTRRRLEQFLPTPVRELVTRRLIGFGQELCLPRGQRCNICPLALAGLCPSAKLPTSARTQRGHDDVQMHNVSPRQTAEATKDGACNNDATANVGEHQRWHGLQPSARGVKRVIIELDP